ncbi:hypothetical protein B9Z19DRAFT_1135422 [Tuber borchii]|uniref:Uncharacterized protein n=1 Tax=Tuber borchii TaxID=42251 RepID=A0A2T6ZCT0_TUBBO|nr:hypothetical protein B9Z19DRAFT_1135422 [Tuber borchii]
MWHSSGVATVLKRRITSSDLHPRDSLLGNWPPLPVALNQISNQVTNDAGVPLDLEYADTKLSDNALARSGGVLRMLPERRPITKFEGEHIRASTGESFTSGEMSDSSDEDETSSAEDSAGPNPSGAISMRRTSMSLLAAAEGEQKAMSARYSVCSLLPSISITPLGSVPGATSPAKK